MANCNIRFMDNQKIVDGVYTITNEDVTYPFSNALGQIRSRIFKSTGNTAWRLTLDLSFQDKITALCLFAPLGQTLGITREATIRLQADNVADWSSPELSIDLSLSSDDRLVHFLDPDTVESYRFWSLYIDDPANPDVISFAHIYMGDYTTTEFRNVSNGFKWSTKDPSTSSKSINGTAYFDIKTKYDSFDGLQFGYCLDGDRQILEGLYERNGIHTFMPISIDPTGATVSGDIEKLTRLARFTGQLVRDHQIAEYYSLGISLEEVI